VKAAWRNFAPDGDTISRCSLLLTTVFIFAADMLDFSANILE